MSREKIKTFILMTLFLTSVFLTEALLVSDTRSLIPSFGYREEETADSSYYLNIISPEKIVVSYSDDNNAILRTAKEYGLWSEYVHLLKQVLSSEEIKVSKYKKEEYEGYSSLRYVKFDFEKEMPFYVLAKLMDIQIDSKLYNELESVKSHFVYLGTEPFVVFEQKDSYVRVDAEDLDVSLMNDRIKQLSEEGYIRYYPGKTLGISDDIYIPLKIKKSIANIDVENEVSLLKEHEIKTLVDNFFEKDSKYLKRIVETDKSNVYIYDQEVLKINPNGLLEYFNTLEKSVVKRNLQDSLKAALDFIQNKQKSQADIYISNIEEIENGENKGYKIGFSYSINERIIELKPEKREELKLNTAIEVEVYGNYVTKYRSFIRKRIKSSDLGISYNKIKNIQEVLEENISFIREIYLKEKKIELTAEMTEEEKKELIETYDVLESIENIALVYKDEGENSPQQEMKISWKITMFNKDYLFEASGK